MNERYSRQIMLPEIGEKGQQQMYEARVLIVGVGGLGSPTALYLTAAGIGHLGLVDADTVSLSNLQRQVLYKTSEVGESKALCAQHHLHKLSPHTHIEAYNTMIGPPPCASSSRNTPQLGVPLRRMARQLA